MTTETNALTAPQTAEIAAYSGAPLAAHRAGAANPGAVYLASLSAGSQPAALGSLAEIAALLLGIDKPKRAAEQRDLITATPWAAFADYGTAAALRARLAEKYHHRTANKILTFYRRIIEESWRLRLITAEQRDRARDIKRIEGDDTTEAATGRALSLGEFMALVNANTDDTAASARNIALLAVGYAAGLRRAEIAGLELGDYEPASSTTGARLTVVGKRNKKRQIPIEDPAALAALGDWLTVRGSQPGPLFVRIRRGDTLTAERLTPQALRLIFEDMAAAAGVPPFSPHDLRRTFAGDLLDAGADLATVQRLMGHSSPTTTAGYDRRGERTRRAAVKALHFPYTARAARRTTRKEAAR